MFVLALAGVHAIGAAVLFALPRPRHDLLPRFSLTGLVGALALTAEMFLLAIAGIPWSIPRLAALPAALAVSGVLRRPTRVAARRTRLSSAFIASAIVVLIVAYAAVTGRATSMDLTLFWGAKSERFALARSIDVEFLGQPDHYGIHPDYPPLLPFLNAFGTMAAGRFPWGASLLVMPWFLAMATTAFHAGTRDREAPAAAGWLTPVFAGTVGLAAVAALTAGNADLILIAYETAALSLLVRRSAGAVDRWAAGAALAGGCLVKIEGAFFAAIAVAAFVVTDRGEDRGRGAVALSLPPTIAVGAWVMFCRAHGLLDFYAGGKIGPFTLQNLGKIPPAMLRAASYDSFFVPWIALGLAAFACRRRRFSPFPAAVAAGLLAVNVFFYLHGTNDPTRWIGWSAGRTLISVLVCGFVAIGGQDVPEGPVAAGRQEDRRAAALAPASAPAAASASPMRNDPGRYSSRMRRFPGGTRNPMKAWLAKRIG